MVSWMHATMFRDIVRRLHILNRFLISPQIKQNDLPRVPKMLLTHRQRLCVAEWNDSTQIHRFIIRKPNISSTVWSAKQNRQTKRLYLITWKCTLTEKCTLHASILTLSKERKANRCVRNTRIQPSLRPWRLFVTFATKTDRSIPEIGPNTFSRTPANTSMSAAITMT